MNKLKIRKLVKKINKNDHSGYGKLYIDRMYVKNNLEIQF